MKRSNIGKMTQVTKYILLLLVLIASLIASYFVVTNEVPNNKPTIKIAFHNMWPAASISKNTPISVWPKVIADKIYLFLHPEEILKEFGILNEILQEKYNIKITDTNPDIIIDTVFGDIPIPKTEAIKIFFTGEAIKVRNPDNYDLAMGFDYINHPNYIRLPLYYMYPIYDARNIRAGYNRGTCNPHKPYFACFLYSNGGESNPKRFDGAGARNSLFDKLSEYKKVESGGKYRNNIGHMIAQEDTMNWMSQCKFVISYENQTYDGYMTEKPFLSYFSGAVPLYYGDKHAMEDINHKAMIVESDFPGQNEMVEYIKKVDNDDALYCDIWNQKIITDPTKDYAVIKATLRAKLNTILENNLKKQIN